MNASTEHLFLRPWREEDAPELYKYACDERVGPPAGWAAHKSVEDSLNILRTVLINENTWAICEKGSNEPIGSIGIFPTAAGAENGWEIGYWLAVPYWGRGYVPEAVRHLINYCFEVKNAASVWCSHADFNEKSKRVIEKCGFAYRFNKPWDSPMGDTRNSLYYSINREEHIK